MGIYTALRVLEPAEIFDFCKQYNIKRHGKVEKRLHCTVLYSRDLNTFPEADNSVHECVPTHFEMLTDSNGNNCVLALMLHAPSVADRHSSLMKMYSCTYDFPEYRPHITLSYNFSGDIKSLPLLISSVKLGCEYSEKLKE
jgi:hypothetical protein